MLAVWNGVFLLGQASGRTILILHYLKAQRSTFPAMQTLQLGSHADEVERVTNAVMRRLMDGKHNMSLFGGSTSSAKLSEDDYNKAVSRLHEIYSQMWDAERKYRSDSNTFDNEGLLMPPKDLDLSLTKLQDDPLFDLTIKTDIAGTVRHLRASRQFETEVEDRWRQAIQNRERLLFENATDEQNNTYFFAEAGDFPNERSIADYRQTFFRKSIELPSRRFSKKYEAT